jgi:hypothetical protein
MTPSALEVRLRAVVPRLLVLADRHLARLIRRRLDRGEATPTAHDITLRVTAEELHDDEILTERITPQETGDYLAVPEPDDLHLEHRPEPELLRFYWQLLFCDAVGRAVAGSLPESRHAELLNEARFVLESDHRIPDGADDETVWTCFLSRAATRAAFAPDSIPYMFPALGTADRVSDCLPAHIDVTALLAQTRPDGAADAISNLKEISGTSGIDGDVPLPETVPPFGNFVHQAVSRWHAGDRVAAASALGNLLVTLKPILGWSVETTREWGRSLHPLLAAAQEGYWPHARRLLSDLQTLAQDLSGELYTVDLPGAIRSRFRKPVRRRLTVARDVLLHRKLSSALRHLDHAHLSEAHERRLAGLLQHETERAERQIREILGPIIAASLADAGFVPANTVERIAQDAAVAELLDKVCQRGFLRFGDLRDAIAKHGPKMSDLSGIREWTCGDALLRADRLLAHRLDGVYHRGELYLRMFQRMSSIGFGNRVGRWATLYLILPFLGAFLALEFTQHVVHGAIGVYGVVSNVLAPKPNDVPADRPPEPEPLPRPAPVEPPAEEPDFFDFLNEPVRLDTDQAARVFTQVVTSSAGHDHPGPHFVTWPAIFVLGLFLLGLLHWPAFRTFTWAIVTALGRFLRAMCYTAPLALWNSPFLRRLRNHPAAKFLYRRFSTSTALTLVLAGTMFFLGATPGRILRWTMYSFVTISLFANTPIGRRFEDDTAGALADLWKLIRVNLLPGIVSWFVWVFRELVGAFERLLYSVDEWFRFREGQARPNVALKAALSLVWFPLAYVVRFAFNLLIEPQVNPIKHFPVVTVSHKVLFAAIPAIRDLLGVSEATVVAVIWCIPGIFGFLAWEFMENWRLYRATRSRMLRPLAIGHHGETVRGLLRPGFHSGTVPKLFRKMRVAIRKAERKGVPVDHHRFEHDRHHVAEAAARLIERQFLAYLRTTPEWAGRALSAGTVSMTCRTIRVDVNDPQGRFATIRFEYDGHEVRQSVEELNAQAWSAEERMSFERALRGLAARSAAGEQIDRETWERSW